MLDVGCGTGDLLKMVQESNPELELAGLDATETMLCHARKLVPSATLVIKDACSLHHYSDHSIGALMCTFVTHHLTDANFELAIREFGRVLSPAAPVYHCYWHGEGSMEPFQPIDSKANVGPPLLKKRTAEDVDAAFARAGFQKDTGRIDTYEWGDMGFAIYVAPAAS